MHVHIYAANVEHWISLLVDMERNRKWFNVPEMKNVPSNFFGPEGPADKTGSVFG